MLSGSKDHKYCIRLSDSFFGHTHLTIINNYVRQEDVISARQSYGLASDLRLLGIISASVNNRESGII